MSAPVEVTTKHATSVETLADAWAFVMARLDQCGDAPTIRIAPVWGFEADEIVPRFEVVVEGMTEEPS